jgi:hypothetical protein
MDAAGTGSTDALMTGRTRLHLPFQPRIERSRCELFQNVAGFTWENP